MMIWLFGIFAALSLLIRVVSAFATRTDKKPGFTTRRAQGFDVDRSTASAANSLERSRVECDALERERRTHRPFRTHRHIDTTPSASPSDSNRPRADDANDSGSFFGGNSSDSFFGGGSGSGGGFSGGGGSFGGGGASGSW
jgi:uncharacterized membrane protein YgcG